jgi:hypothetical protein
MPLARELGNEGALGPGSGILRLFRFRPARPAFDAVLRTVMLPDLARVPGVVAIHMGRQGPTETGERLVASLWTSREAMAAAVGESFERPVFHPEYIDETVDKRLDVAKVAFATETGPRLTPNVVRLLVGRARPGRLAGYVEAARAGTEEDIAAGRGPLALYLGVFDDERFVTLSLWGQWSKIGEATGGSIDAPTVTRHRELLADWHIDHYEAVPTAGDDSAG